jgi:hypothetical protein
MGYTKQTHQSQFQVFIQAVFSLLQLVQFQRVAVEGLPQREAPLPFSSLT